ncbi:hypothetical protein [Variovorax sp. EL159]|uniref:hypothetical protein n=1 Tax=unclassified Variovorax TaxID=663243 RepID=UPI00088AB0FD|nr:hypothetical protein [Variovorax sp. EL159]SCX70316.1 hypothetical protein SAMN03159363_3498 [Variovorax sp. EL159]
MTPERFEELADAWGAELRRWPDAERADAQALLERDASARTILARAAELDALLDASAVASPSAALIQAALAGAPAHGAKRGRVGRWLGEWWGAGAWAAGVGLVGTAAAGALVFGLALSAIAPPGRPTGMDRDWAATTFDAGNTADWSDE